ncbi:restriction endonuclease subunit S [Microbulbifer bruguierae]|uniref:Restriction endonuclease subunit S n=1 Tax=Microbulbifer bruguierae TaxID=3029061 RepID=A0ABY8NBH6_9GAMM|nr:restriction endonuclease subunit S [Microbulbifer bruguierae]WGL16274.1 restriction endonuclease subunit S [Microbulbifer bruguierae]
MSIDDIKANSKNAIAIGPFGSRMKSDCYVESGVAVIRGTNLSTDPEFVGDFVYITEEKADELVGCNVYEGDLVFPHRGAIGEVGIVSDKSRYVLSSSLMKLTCNLELANPQFIYYFFKSRIGRYELLKNASQVGTPGIGQPLSSLKSIKLRLPPLEIQEEVAATIGQLNSKISLNRRTNQTLEQIAQTLFKSWFVDFDPVRAKVAVREYFERCAAEQGEPMPSSADLEKAQNNAAAATIAGLTFDPADIDGTRKLLESKLAGLEVEQRKQLMETAALFSGKIMEPGKDEYPEGWSWGYLSEVCSLNSTSWTKKNAPNQICYVDLANTKNGEIHRVENFNWEDAPSRARRVLNPGDTIVGTVRPGNRSYARIGRYNTGLTGSTGFAVLTPKAPHWVEFLYVAATCDEAIERLAHLADGGAYPAVKPNVVVDAELIIPPDSVAERFSALISPMFERIDTNNQSSKTLAELRDLLLPKLLSGEIQLNQEAPQKAS